MTQPVNFSPLRMMEAMARPSAPAAGMAERQESDASQVAVAQLTNLVRALASGGPPVDHARIAQIRQAIATGSYSADAQEIADAMLRHFGWTGG